MKKALSIVFVVLFAFSCVSVLAFAGNDQTVDNSVTVNVPDFITIKTQNGSNCVFCGKFCASEEAYATHLDTCEGFAEFLVTSAENECYYCGKTFKNAKALNMHYEVYNNCKDHIASCPNSGEDYVDGGCTFKCVEKAELEKHIAQCPCAGKYTTEGKIKHYLKVALDFLVNAVKGADWKKMLSSVGDLFKALFAGVKVDI